MLMAYEVTRDMPTQLIEIETPLETMHGPVIDGKKTVFVSIMRAGAASSTACSTCAGARVGHIGLYRDPKTLVAVEYYFKMPADMHERDAIVLDPMLATGNSAVAAVDRLKETRRSRSASSACWRRRKGSRTSMRTTRTCRSTPPRSTAS
jgi:uracil phosphoribosyltransferase